MLQYFMVKLKILKLVLELSIGMINRHTDTHMSGKNSLSFDTSVKM